MPDLKREYILVRKGTEYYYARKHSSDPDMYVVQSSVSQVEGKDIVNRANAGSDYNKQQEEQLHAKSEPVYKPVSKPGRKRRSDT